MRRAAQPVPETTPATSTPNTLDRGLAALVAERAPVEGSSDSPWPGLAFHRISAPQTILGVRYTGPIFTVIAQGSKTTRFGDRDVRYDPSRYLVITGEVDCETTILEASRERPFLAVSLELPPDVITKTLLTLADAQVEPIDEPIPAFVSPLDGPVRDGLIRLLAAVDDPLERRVIAPLVLEELIFRLLRTEAAAVLRRAVGRRQDVGDVQEAMRFMRQHVGRSLSVEEVARHVAMSPSHFAHRFQAIARVSPMRYLKQLRLQEARTLLLGEGARVGEAAQRVGYESPSHFSRDFKSHFGSTPAEYLRRFRG